MAYPVPTPYDARITKLRSKIQTKKGPNKKLGGRLNRLRVRQYGAQQNRTPPDQMPWNAQAETTIGTLNRNYGDTNASLTARQQLTEQNYGITDASNPFSRAAMLQQTYERNRANTGNTYAAQGQLYAGSLSDARSFDEGNYLRSQDEMLRQRAAELSGIASERLGAQRTLEEGTAAAKAKALEAALSTPPEPGEAPAVPKFVTDAYHKRISRAQKHHRGGKAKKLRAKLQSYTNPNPV